MELHAYLALSDRSKLAETIRLVSGLRSPLHIVTRAPLKSSTTSLTGQLLSEKVGHHTQKRTWTHNIFGCKTLWRRTFFCGNQTEREQDEVLWFFLSVILQTEQECGNDPSFVPTESSEEVLLQPLKLAFQHKIVIQDGFNLFHNCNEKNHFSKEERWVQTLMNYLYR